MASTYHAVSQVSPGGLQSTQPIPNPVASQTQGWPHNTYRLKRHVRRAFAVFLVPLLLLAFYVTICYRFLTHPPANNIAVVFVGDEGKWVYYAWFVIAVFMLDFGKVALASIEAAALMSPRFAPRTATKLMWHTDNKWANPAWWIRALRATISFGLSKKPRSTSHLPGWMWTGFSLITILLFVTLPLSGLTMNVASVLVPGSTLALIQGPNSSTFNTQNAIDLPKIARNNWQSARHAPLKGESIIYAPHGTTDAVSTGSFFHDEAARYSPSIEFFAGPAVGEAVYGRTWGMYANISCNPVRMDQLQMIRVSFNNYSIDQCLYDDCEDTFFTDCKLAGFKNVQNVFDGNSGCHHMIDFPVWVNKSSSSGIYTQFDMIAVADGSSVDPVYSWAGSYGTGPFLDPKGHDSATYDSLFNRSADGLTTAMFEIVLWETNMWNSTILSNLTSGHYMDPVEVVNHKINDFWPNNETFAGLAVHCDVTSQLGFADVEPAYQTFSSFKPSPAVGCPANLGLTYALVEPPQIIAYKALLVDLDIGVKARSDDTDANMWDDDDQLWVAMHMSLDSGPFMSPWYADWVTTNPTSQYQPFTPKDLQFSMYKLLGESVFAVMNKLDNEAPFEGGLYQLKTVSYITAGAISWKVVLGLLALWAVLISGGAAWSALFTGPRWAPSLSGFEMFKFGAENADIVSQFSDEDFRGCSSALDQVGGMVGMLPGHRGPSSRNDLGFIGLSENVADKNVMYTLDRHQAAVTRPV